MQIELNVLISIGISVVSVGIAYNRWINDIKKDNEERRKEQIFEHEKQTERHIEITKGLEYLTRDVDKLNSNLISVNTKVDNLNKKMIINEQAIKSVHHRMDKVEELRSIHEKED